MFYFHQLSFDELQLLIKKKGRIGGVFFFFFSFFPWPTLFSTKFVRFQSIINIYIYKRKRKKKRRIIFSTLELPEFGNLRDFQAKRIILIESRYININFSFPLDGLFREYATFFFSRRLETLLVLISRGLFISCT